ncbi:MAG: IS66 family insertion sequence element accessory protein TnpB [Ruminococcaceae bacterium]|jgi:transposase-like protein|uniref:Transposase n=1 Tax=Aminicella lysinilytica TaxID=433323 RepID=A0A4R6Q0R4_9FIRM|nr:IS66 family insertion sequence element accessory protein TnpB [Aminicella lysinilytica]NLS86380.1 IS66 family insertion sequence element accessory protein TnpB [Oscillospiraceae bacterium]TDP49838.1 hypothetical protein EV211_1431 [Aminicella lysinilytica]
MDTQLAKQNVRMAQWAAIIKDRVSSGLTINEYCSERGLSRDAYYYWLSKIRKSAIDNNPTAFAELTPPKDEAKSITAETHVDFNAQVELDVAGVRIAINESTPRDLLKMVLEVVSDAE